MDANKIAERLIQYFRENRQVGHTKAVLQGANRTNANIVVATEAELENALKGIKGEKLISLAEIEAGELDKENVRGWPLVFDNKAVVALLTELLAATPKPEKKAAKKEKA